MVPPSVTDEATGNSRPIEGAPLARWQNFMVFDTAADCQAAMLGIFNEVKDTPHPLQERNLAMVSRWQCIASDDARLRPSER